MPLCRSTVAGLSVCLTLALGPPAWATMDNLKSFKAAYPGKEAKAYSCKVCHEGVMCNKDNLNTYGRALKQFKAEQGAKKLLAEDYQAFDAVDTDEDGAANAQELEAGTDPLEPASVPTPTPAQMIKKNDVEVQHKGAGT